MKLKYSDKVHGYWLDGKRCRGISTISSIPDDKFQLEQWKLRMVAIGVAANEDVKTEVLAHASGTTGALNSIVSEAMDRAGAHLAAEQGTADHTLTERHDSMDTAEENERLTLARWRNLLDYAGLDVEYIERVVVYPGQHVCGRFDRLARRRSDGALVAVDLKTGGSAIRYPHSVAVQLALYAHAPFMAGDLDDGGVTEHFTPMPDDIDLDRGYMIHVPEDGEGGVYVVNIKRGWDVASEVIFPTLEWRDTKHDSIIKKF